jgi:hypothetical protein
MNGTEGKMKFKGSLIYVAIIFMVLCQNAFAGTLSGRIIKEDGKSLAKTKIIIEGKEITTNDFGGYQVELPDGERELRATIENVNYTSEKVLIYSPKTEQNWRMDSKSKKLVKIR